MSTDLRNRPDAGSSPVIPTDFNSFIIGLMGVVTRRLEVRMICEAWGNLCLVDYGSGRFCGQSCARSFSTRKNKEIANTRRIASLKAYFAREGKGKGLHLVARDCLECSKRFTPKRHKNQIYCSSICAHKSPKVREKMSIARSSAIQDGKNVSKQAIRCVFTSSLGRIRCDSKLEYTCLDWFTRNYQITSITRCSHILRYQHGNVLRRYMPDFEIHTTKGIYLVECKMKVHYKDLDAKWGDYNAKAVLKKKALIEFAEEHGMIPLWFLPEMHRTFYQSLNREILKSLSSDKALIELK